MTGRARAVRIVLIVAAVAAAGGAYWWRNGRIETGGPLVLQGNVEVRQVDLGFNRVGGRVKDMFVNEGDQVKPGQKLASLDKVYFEDALRQARAQRDQAAANLAKMEAGNRPEEIAQAEAAVAEREAAAANAATAVERATQLLKSRSGTQKAYDDAIAAKRQTQAQLQSARASLALMKAGFRKEDVETARAQLADRKAAVAIAERQLEDADLYAPNAGVVLTRVREPGAIVNPGETVFVVSLTNPVWVRTYVSEPDLGRVKPGMTVELQTDAPGAKPLTGRVGFIATTAEFTPKTVQTPELRTALVYRIRVLADDPTGELRQGMPLTIKVPENDAIASASR